VTFFTGIPVLYRKVVCRKTGQQKFRMLHLLNNSEEPYICKECSASIKKILKGKIRGYETQKQTIDNILIEHFQSTSKQFNL